MLVAAIGKFRYLIIIVMGNLLVAHVQIGISLPGDLNVELSAVLWHIHIEQMLAVRLSCQC
ncbi:Uncharacterised protein [Vibrio cholerae]|nr:Uncharacterised protein [Vibrio cholerae]